MTYLLCFGNKQACQLQLGNSWEFRRCSLGQAGFSTCPLENKRHSSKPRKYCIVRNCHLKLPHRSQIIQVKNSKVFSTFHQALFTGNSMLYSRKEVRLVSLFWCPFFKTKGMHYFLFREWPFSGLQQTSMLLTLESLYPDTFVVLQGAARFKSKYINQMHINSFLIQ